MINEKLHLLFHDLSGRIGGINTMWQICIAYIKKFDLERLDGKFKENITVAFRNIPSYRKATIEKLKLVIGALNKLGSRDITETLESAINHGLEELEEIEYTADTLYHQLLEHDTKENLMRFAEELEKLGPVCRSMIDAIGNSKNKLTALGKY